MWSNLVGSSGLFGLWYVGREMDLEMRTVLSRKMSIPPSRVLIQRELLNLPPRLPYIL